MWISRSVVEPMATWCRPVSWRADGHDIPLDGVFVFEIWTPAAMRVIDYLVISDLPPASWWWAASTMPKRGPDWTVMPLRSPDGFTGTVTFKVSARVVDLGDNNEGMGAPACRRSPRRLHGAPHSGQVAADVDFDNSTLSPGWRITASTSATSSSRW